MIFQSAIEQVIRPLKKTGAYLDNILVSGESDDDHIENLRQLFLRLREKGLRLIREKCEFGMTQITYLIHDIDAQGI
jgi:hypothetical protein